MGRSPSTEPSAPVAMAEYFGFVLARLGERFRSPAGQAGSTVLGVTGAASSGPTAFAPELAFALEATKALHELVESLADRKVNNSFLTTLALLLWGVQERLQELRENKAVEVGRVIKLITHLERLTIWPHAFKGPATDVPFNRTAYAKLNDLVHEQPTIKREAKNVAIANIVKLAQSRTYRALRYQQKFQLSFKDFANTQHPPRGPPLSELLNFRPAGDDKDRDSLRVLHTILSGYLLREDSCGGDFRANLALAFAERLNGDEDGVPFHLFLLHRRPDASKGSDMWKEARILVFPPSDPSMPPKAQVQRPTSREISSSADFCEIITHKHRGHLVLHAIGNKLVHVEVGLECSELKTLVSINSSSVSLAKVLEKGKIEQDDRLKVLLSYLLAKAMWKLYDSDWMATDWNKHSIQFMREQINGSSNEVLTLIHRPFFAAELQPSPSRRKGTTRGELSPEDDSEDRLSFKTHLYPKILALGIMLLEIELGEGIEQRQHAGSLDENNKPIENDDHYTAAVIIGSTWWKGRHTYQAIKDMIKICVSPDTEKLGNDSVSVRDNLYKYVVAPLGQLFKLAWPQQNEPEFFSPRPVSFAPTELDSRDLGWQASPCTNLYGRPPVMGSPSDSRSGMTLPIPKEPRTETPQDKADKWFKKFQGLLISFDIGRKYRGENLKVAILDSGVDFGHKNFSKEDRDRMKERRSFIGCNPNSDPTGHGTHIAAIILRLTKNVELYIGQITESETFDQREEIAKAIKHAREVWQVDMISLSFGFKDVDNGNQMGEEITKCLDQKIIVFASASNDGGDGCRTYPAKYDRGHLQNFATVGEHIRPVWGIPKNRVAMTYKCGTSFATPVAVSIAAFMICYIRITFPDESQWFYKPWTPVGMTRIFGLLATRIGDYDWVSPMRFIEQDEGIIRMKLQEHLH